MMTLIEKLASNNISLWVVGQTIKMAFAGQTPDAAIVAEIKANKPELIGFLQQNNIDSQGAFKQFTGGESKPAIEAIFPATSLQQGFVYHHLSEPNDDAYRVQLMVDYHQALNINNYQKAWALASLRYPILRTAFDWAGEILQVVTPGASIDASHFAFIDISDKTPADKEKALHDIQQQDRQISFDLAKPGLIRFTVIKQAEALFTVIKTNHHAISDGWSGPILNRTVHGYYDQLQKGITPEVEVENGYLEAQSYYQREQHNINAHWDKVKAGFGQSNDINALLSRPLDLATHQSMGLPQEQELSLSGECYQALKSLCRDQGVTLNVVLQFGWHKLLQAYCQDEQTIVGTTVSGRDIPVAGIESSVGIFINTLPLAVDWAKDATVADVLDNIQHNIAGLNSYSSISLAKLQPRGEQLFHSLFVFENYPASTADATQPGAVYEKIGGSARFRQSVEKADYPLSLLAYEHDGQVVVKLIYAEKWLDSEQAERLLNQLQLILDAAAANPKQAHGAISLLDDIQRQMILKDWNQSDALYQKNVTLPQLFEQQVAKTPDAEAIVFDGQSLSYSQLNQQANQLARKLDVKPDTLVGLYLDRGLDMVVAMLAVLKAGGAYVPVSPEYPEQRSGFILKDSQAPIILTQPQHLSALDNLLTNEGLNVQLVMTDSASDMPDTNLTTSAAPTNLAYVIYTSGTTGQPKGVMVSHQNTANLISAQTTCFNVTDCQRALQFAAYVFDASVFELFVCLVNGLTVYVANDEQRTSPELLAKLIGDNNIEFATLPPAMLTLMNEQAVASLKTLITAGESPSLEMMQRFSEVCRVYNAYGPTESTVCASANLYQPGDLAINIGGPISNTQLYVLDENLAPVGVGITAELYIGGDSLARGYLNRPELNEERFIINPFDATTRLYKTGDLVRWLPNGQLAYMGRNDFQVKIRGYRIELGEIENALLALPQVKQAVVIDRNVDHKKSLAAYVVSNSGELIGNEALLNALSETLPDYMIPATFTYLDEVPLTINGKVDRRALPTPQVASDNNYCAAKTELQTQLCDIWQAVLGLEKVGIHDNFFTIGGDSIVSIQLVSKLRKAGLNLQVKAIFAAPTVAQLAVLISDSQAQAAIRAEQGTLKGEFELLPIQQWFFEQNLPSAHHWNQAFMIKLTGSVTVAAINKALKGLANQHDMLRCRVINGKNSYQKSTMAALRQLDVSQVDSDELVDRLTRLQSHFDISNGPLWQAAHLTGYADGSARLFLAFHHLIIDAVSWRIIAEDINSLLNNQSLSDKTSSYRQWVETVGEYADNHKQQADFWQKVVADQRQPQSLQAPTVAKVAISEAQTTVLLRQANQGYNTQINDLLLSALAITLSNTFDSADNHILLEGHGREDIDNGIDVSRTVGWFTTTYPVKLTAHNDVDQTIIATKEMLRTIPDKGLGYGALVKAGLINAQLPVISFNYLGQQDTKSTDNGFGQMVTEHCGQVMAKENLDSQLININGAVKGGVLQFTVVSRLSAEQTDLLAAELESALNSVITQGQNASQLGGIYTPSDYGISGLTQERLTNLHRGRSIEGIYPANSLQQGFVFHHLSQPNDDAYRVQLLLDYQTALDVESYKQAWKLASQRFPALRTSFDWDGDVLQLIHSEPGLNDESFTLIDLSEMSDSEQEQAIEQLREKDRTQGFDLGKPGLLRLAIIKRQNGLYSVLKTEHHSIGDGWSGPLLLQCVHDYYNQLTNGQTVEVEVETAYPAAQAYYLKQQKHNDEHWDKVKQGFAQANDINFMLSSPLDLSQTTVVSEVAEQQLVLEGEDYQQLKALCKTQGITLNIALQFGWHKLLQCYSRDEQTIVGTTVSGRDIPVEGIDSSVGLFINTLPVALDWAENASCGDMLSAIGQKIADLNSYSSVSLASLQPKGSRLFHSLFVFENYPVSSLSEDRRRGIEGSVKFSKAAEKADYPLSVSAMDRHNSLTVKLEHGVDWLNETQAKRLLTQLKTLLQAVCADPSQSHQALGLLEQDELQQVLNDFNQTDIAYPDDKTLQHLFEAQVDATPDNIALHFAGQSLTYRQLNEQANQLAHTIRDQYPGVGPDTLIALYVDRGMHMVISILAVLKAGAAYVPVSPDYPKARTTYMLSDTETPLVISQQRYSQTLVQWGAELPHSPAIIHADEVTHANKTNPVARVGVSDLAYVIYTSGTTGQPKGVMVEHGGVVNLLADLHNTMAFTDDEVVLWVSSYVFDASVEQLFIALTAGAQVVIPTLEQIKQPQAIMRQIEQYQVTHIDSTPSYLTALGRPQGDSIRRIVTGGEAATAELKALWGDKLINEYGPTETSIASIRSMDYGKRDEINCIGKPLANTQAYVLDSANQPVAIGVPGELCIGGAGVTRGYLNRSDLTEQCFINNPFGEGRIYKTGDLVRWLPDGNLVYLGRNDNQVKVRGFRIELGEIEAELLELNEVKQAVVILREHNDNQYLAAYVVSTPGHQIDHVALKARLAGKLPEHMLPDSITQIDEVPLTINGKLDARALPDPVLAIQDNYVAPTNDYETQLALIWQDVLGIERVGIQDNFFDIGGHSLLAIKMLAAVAREFEVQLDLTEAFNYKTLAALAGEISNIYWVNQSATADESALTGEEIEEFTL